MLAKQVRFMDAAHEKSELIWQWIVKGAADDPHNSELSSAQQAWAASMERAAMESMKRTWFLDPLVISRNCIHEGCRVIFSPATSYARTSRAMQHLLSVAGILSKCLGHWERAHVGSGADDVSFPAAAIWGRGMLHWFQSCLCAAGALPQAHIEEARLRNGVRGWSRAEALRPGISSVCSSLLMAQAVSMDDRQQPELLAACLPATVALGHLLRGDGLPSSNCSTASASFVQQIATTPSVHVPMHPPLILKDGDSVTVRRVLPGTRQAKDLARNHLRGVMEAINISGSYLAPDKANTLADVGNSETIWEGICLYKSLGPDYELVGGQHPDLLTSID